MEYLCIGSGIFYIAVSVYFSIKKRKILDKLVKDTENFAERIRDQNLEMKGVSSRLERLTEKFNENDTPITMHDLYGDGSKCIVCLKCGFCKDHGDCICPKDESKSNSMSTAISSKYTYTIDTYKL